MIYDVFINLKNDIPTCVGKCDNSAFVTAPKSGRITIPGLHKINSQFQASKDDLERGIGSTYCTGCTLFYLKHTQLPL